jgi:hypothetical protein
MPILKIPTSDPNNPIIIDKPIRRSLYYKQNFICEVGHPNWLICNCLMAKVMRMEDMGLFEPPFSQKERDIIRDLI